MKNEKGLITRVITGIREKLPDGEDVFGYSGVSKELLVRALDENYAMLDAGLWKEHVSLKEQ